MDSLYRAAVIWDSLSDTEYQIVIGRRGKTRTLHIRFRAADFFHLSGMHYASDVDFKLHKKQFDGARLIGALLSGKLDGSLIGKSRNYQEKIAGRLRCLCHLPDFFEGDFELYEYPCGSPSVSLKNRSAIPFISRTVRHRLFFVP